MPRRDVSDIPGLVVVEPPRHGDARGFFSETYNRAAFAARGIDVEFVQDNHSLSAAAGVLRGLHFQTPPYAQDKLVRVTRGRVLDVVVDIRRGSPTWGDHAAIELSAENWRQLYVPAGFAHGFLTLEPGCEVLYKVTAYYAPTCDRCLLWSDPALDVDWGVAHGEAIVSVKDAAGVPLATIDSPFAWTESP